MQVSPRTSSAVLLIFLVFGLLAAQTSGTTPVQDFQIDGVAVFQCQCPAHTCPCQHNGGPTHGTCDAADFAHIRKGHYGNVKLDGLNIAMVGDLVDANADRLFSTLYVDQKASPEQREALTKMLSYMNDQYTALPGEAAVPFRGVKSVLFEFSESSDRTIYRVGIPGLLEEQAVLKRDAAGKPISTIAAMDMWSNVEHNMDNVTFKYHDREVGKEWDYSGRYANVKYFHLTRKMYASKEMLGQHGDMTGAWTAEQKEIIRKAGLKQ